MELQYRGKKVKVDSDVFDISGRLRKLNKNFYLKYDLENHKYEVHNDEHRPATLEFTIPFDELDARTIDYVRASMGKNPFEAMEEIERHNEKVQREHNEKLLDIAHQKSKEAMEYVTKHEHEEHIPTNAFTTKWV